MQVKLSAKLSALEGRLLSWAQMTGAVCADNKQISSVLRFSPVQTNGLLSRMHCRGIIVQLRRGLYLLPQKLPPGGVWQPSVDLAIWFFLKDKKAAWQETGPSAFNYHGLSEQVANQPVVYNDRFSGIRQFGRLSVVFVKVPAERLGSFVELDLPSDPKVKRRMGSLARIILDAVYDHTRFGTLPKAYRWIEQRKNDSRFIKELVNLSLRYGNVATNRRIGWLLERIGVALAFYQPLLKSLKPSTSFIPADPIAPKKGKTNMRWNIVENFNI